MDWNDRRIYVRADESPIFWMVLPTSAPDKPADAPAEDPAKLTPWLDRKYDEMSVEERKVMADRAWRALEGMF